MKKTLLILALIIMTIPNLSFAKIQCPPLPKPKLKFAMKKTRTQFDFSKDVSTLTRENTGTTMVGWLNEGIMSSKFPNYRISAKINGIEYPNLNKACYWIEEIDFLWVFSPTINVAKEYKKGSCKYETIIAHERQHVSIDIKVLKSWTNKIEKALNIILSRPIATGIVTIDNKVDLLPVVERQLKPVIDKMVIHRNREQMKIDTVEEYTRLANKCK